MNNMACIRSLLDTFKRAYTERNTENADHFMSQLFDIEDPAFVTGTSNAELCFDYDSIRKLFVSDWQDWGDLHLDVDRAAINVSDGFAWAHCPATVKYTFSDTDKTFSGFVGFIREYFDGCSYDSHKTSKIRFAEINWLLAHLLHSRKPEENRDYHWSMRVFFVLRKLRSIWKIRHIQFSLPHNDPFADARFSEYTSYKQSYDLEKSLFTNHSNAHLLTQKETTFILDFYRRCLTKEGSSGSGPGDFLAEDIFFVNSNSDVYTGSSHVIPLWDEMREFWDHITLNTDTLLTDKTETNIWIHTTGVFRKTVTEAYFDDITEKSILRILDKDIPDKDKLFLIRRNISIHFKELAYGTELEFPFRFDACIRKQKDRMRFDYVQISLPFDTILEQINEVF